MATIRTLAALAALGSSLGACQLVAGLSGLHEVGSGGASSAGGHASSSASAGGGGHGGSSSSGSPASSSSSTTTSSSSGSPASSSSSTTSSATTSSSSSSGACGPDLGTDPHNCGACGHDCLGGDCVGGECQAVPLLTTPGPLTQLASDGSYVYWATPSSILRTNIAAPAEMQIAAGVAPRGLAVDGSTVYFTEPTAMGGHVMRVPAAGGMPTEIVNQSLPSAQIAYRADALLVWRVVGDTSIYSNPTMSFSLKSTFTMFPINAFAIDDASVYFCNGASFDQSLVGSAMPLLMAPCGSTVNGVAADQVPSPSGHVYWTDLANQGTVHRATKGKMGTDVAVKSTASYPKDIVADASAVYWVELGGPAMSCLMAPQTSFVWKSPADLSAGPGKVAVATCPLLAQDLVAIYFTSIDPTSASVTIYRLAK